jgi:hypothetical protein
MKFQGGIAMQFHSGIALKMFSNYVNQISNEFQNLYCVSVIESIFVSQISNIPLMMYTISVKSQSKVAL